jgi:hypothetical protein
MRQNERHRRWAFAFLVNEVDASFSRLVAVVPERRETIELQFPIKGIHPVVAKVNQEIAFDAGPRTDACNGVRPSCLPQAMAQIIHCGLREGREEWLDHMKISSIGFGAVVGCKDDGTGSVQDMRGFHD